MEWKQNRIDKENDIRRLEIMNNKSCNVEIIDNGSSQMVVIDNYYGSVEIPREIFDKIIERYAEV